MLQMRTLFAGGLLALAIAFGSSVGCAEETGDNPDPQGCGGPNTPNCDRAHRCVDGVCKPCGAQNQYCCIASVESSAQPACDDPLATCVSEIDGPGHCDNTCGALNLKCCETATGPDCGADAIDDSTGTAYGVVCQLDLNPSKCVFSDACNIPGTEEHFVELIDPGHCVMPERFYFNSIMPDACIAQHIAMNFPGATFGPLDTPAAVIGEYCDGATGQLLTAMTDADMLLCQKSLCDDCVWELKTTCP